MKKTFYYFTVSHCGEIIHCESSKQHIYVPEIHMMGVACKAGDAYSLSIWSHLLLRAHTFCMTPCYIIFILHSKLQSDIIHICQSLIPQCNPNTTLTLIPIYTCIHQQSNRSILKQPKSKLLTNRMLFLTLEKSENKKGKHAAH